MEKYNRVVVVGVGNLLLKDEGIGIHVARALQELNLPGVEIVDGGTSPDSIPYLEPADRLIIVDAAEFGDKPGTIRRFRPEDLADETGGAMSLHELGVLPSLKMMSLLGNESKDVITIGIQPKEIDWGTELSPKLQQKVPEIVKTVLREIER